MCVRLWMHVSVRGCVCRQPLKPFFMLSFWNQSLQWNILNSHNPANVNTQAVLDTEKNEQSYQEHPIPKNKSFLSYLYFIANIQTWDVFTTITINCMHGSRNIREVWLSYHFGKYMLVNITLLGNEQNAINILNTFSFAFYFKEKSRGRRRLLSFIITLWFRQKKFNYASKETHLNQTWNILWHIKMISSITKRNWPQICFFTLNQKCTHKIYIRT